MKAKLIMVGLTVVLALSLLACSSGAVEEPISPSYTVYTVKTAVFIYTCEDFMNQKHITDEVTITVDDGVNVILCSNPTTGFQWSEEARISDTTVLEQVSHEYIAPDSELAGAAGQEMWKFEALKEGTATISMEYSRPWEGGEKAEWTYTLAVTVK